MEIVQHQEDVASISEANVATVVVHFEVPIGNDGQTVEAMEIVETPDPQLDVATVCPDVDLRIEDSAGTTSPVSQFQEVVLNEATPLAQLDIATGAPEIVETGSPVLQLQKVLLNTPLVVLGTTTSALEITASPVS
ncbi:unnamed protein product [Calypogeia fissa]